MYHWTNREKKKWIDVAYIPACTQITEHNHSQTSGAVYCNVPEYQCTRKLSMLNCSPTHPPTPDEAKRPPSLFLLGGKKGQMRRQGGEKMVLRDGQGMARAGQGMARAEWLTLLGAWDRCAVTNPLLQASSTSEETNRKGDTQGISQEISYFCCTKSFLCNFMRFSFTLAMVLYL